MTEHMNIYIHIRLLDMHLRALIGLFRSFKVRKRANARNQYNQVTHLTKDTNEKVTNSQLDITNESREISPFPVCEHKPSINRRTIKHNKHKTDITCIIHKRCTALERSVNYFTGVL